VIIPRANQMRTALAPAQRLPWALALGFIWALTGGIAHAEWQQHATAAARSASGPDELRLWVRFDRDCTPTLVVGRLARQRTLRPEWGRLRASVDGTLIATGEHSLGRRVRLTDGALAALSTGGQTTISIGDTRLQVSLDGAADAIAAAAGRCAGDRPVPAPKGAHWTVVSGDIGTGWAQAVMDIARAVGATGLVIDSHGTDLAEADALARWVQQRGLNTAVTGDCALACARAFAGGVLRFIAPGARLGLQGASLLGDAGSDPDRAAHTATQPHRPGSTPGRHIAARATDPAEPTRWLTADQAIELGLATELGTPGGLIAN
jgi:hypothetical protein